MNIKRLLDDDQAVSPVIGVILMVAITVILAAVIGTFVLGLGGQLSKTAPTASFQFDYSAGSPDTLTIAHAGGDTLQASNVHVKANAEFNHSALASSTTSTTWANIAGSTEVSAGDTITITAGSANTNEFADDTVRVVWSSSGGDQSAVLGKWSGPEAS